MTSDPFSPVLLSQRLPVLKVCGLTRAEDVSLCLELGIAFTGFIFVAQSPRYLSPASAALLPHGNARRVGVFAGQSPETILAIMRVAKLDYAQLHGGEDPSFCRAVGANKVIKVLWPEKYTVADLEQQVRLFAPVCSLFLLDAGSSGGGSGLSLDWQGLAAFASPKPWLLAGGLGPDNATKALCCCSPHGLDCNSAVEYAPGVKDHDKLRALAALVHGSQPFSPRTLL